MISRLAAGAFGLSTLWGATPPAGADTFVPVAQDRFTSVLVTSDCEGTTSGGEAAQAFEPFDSLIDTIQQCPKTSIFASAVAHQTSEIGGASMTAFAGAQYFAQSPGSVFASGMSNFAVTFEVPRAGVFSLDGVLLGSGQVPGVETTVQLTGPQDELLLLDVLTGPFALGEPTEQPLDAQLVLEPGVYTLQARALAGDGIDIAQPSFAGESALNITVGVAVLGDLNGDEVVDVLDFLALLAAWGPCDGCPEDLDGDGVVGILDLLALLANWG